MGIVSGAVSAANWSLDALGLGWLTGITSAPINDIVITMDIPDISTVGIPAIHRAQYTLYVPNHSVEFGKIALNMAQNITSKIEIVIALQQIIDEEGGITIKDQLDPYHYQVIKNALEENGETVPPVTNQEATTLNQLGGEITETGILSNLSAAADALAAVGAFSLPFASPTNSQYPAGVMGQIPLGLATQIAEITASQQTLGFGPDSPETQALITNLIYAGGQIPPPATPPAYAGPMDVLTWISGRFPDYAKQLQIINSCVSIDGFITSYIVSNFRNAIDTEAGALVIKSAMGDFAKRVSDQAIQDTGNTPPDWEEPTGATGVR
jgi:hypothetical protein